MKIHVAISSPQLVEADELDNLPEEFLKSNKILIETFLKKARPAKVGNISTLEAVYIDKGKVREVHAITNSGKVVFFSSLLVGRDYVEQDFIWKYRGWKPGFATKWMLQLLEHKSAIKTSEAHKPEGKKLWLKFIKEALASGKFVYVIENKSERVREVGSITKELEAKIWTTSVESKYMGILVTNKRVKYDKVT